MTNLRVVLDSPWLPLLAAPAAETDRAVAGRGSPDHFKWEEVMEFLGSGLLTNILLLLILFFMPQGALPFFTTKCASVGRALYNIERHLDDRSKRT